MNSSPLVSVIIPNHNCQHFLRQCLDSVLSQSYKNIEIILIDDASSDNSVSFVANHFPTVKVIALKENCGSPAKPRNLGISESEGEFIAFLDSDDYWREDKIEKQLSYMLENDLDFCSTSGVIVDKRNNRIGTIKPRVKQDSKFVLDDLIKHSFIITSSVMIKNERKAWLKFNENDIFKSCGEDLSLWLECAFNYKNLSCMSDEFIYYRSHDESISKVGNWQSPLIYRDICVYDFLVKHGMYDKLIKYKLRSLLYFLYYGLIA